MTIYAWELDKKLYSKRSYMIDLEQIASLSADWDRQNNWWQCSVVFRNGAKETVWISDTDFKQLKKNLAKI